MCLPANPLKGLCTAREKKGPATLLLALIALLVLLFNPGLQSGDFRNGTGAQAR
jgi:hypothetical protein